MLIVRPIESQAELDTVCQLAHDEYVRQGYIQPQHGRMLRHYRHLDNIPETTVLIALEDGQLVGTKSYTLDGPAKLPVDCDFPAETAAIREECIRSCQRLGASWRIVTASTARHRLDVALQLIGESLLGMCRHCVNVVLFSLHPRHEGFYRWLLDLRTVAQGTCDSLSGPPAILMRGDCLTMRKRWSEVCLRRQMPFRLANIICPDD